MLKKILYTTLYVILLSSAIDVFAQSECPDNANLGGTNGVDDCTVVYLNFDDENLSNQATLTDDGVAHGNVQFFDVSVNGDLGKALYLNNEAETDSSYVTIPHTDALNLSDNWTIESWFFLNSYGESNEDHRFAPVIMWKPGEPFYDGNYFMETFGDTRHMSTGYGIQEAGWGTVNSEDNLVEAQNWYHVTFIRDTTYHSVIQLFHDKDMNLLSSGWFEYDTSEPHEPILTNRDLHIGFNGGDNVQPSFFDGFLDEIRISNNVRNYEIAPLIVDAEEIPNLGNEASEVPPFTATIGTVGSTEVQNATLHYKVNGEWSSTTMSNDEEDQYSAQIPFNELSGIISYYVSAENSAGQTSYYPQDANEAENPTYLTFSVVEDESRTIGLSFEEGNGEVPIDSSIYQHTINVNGVREYSSDAVEGDLSYTFSTDSDDYLEVNSSVIGNSEEFSVDFWYKMTDDYVASYDNGDFWKFITNKGAIDGCAGCWGENTFEVILGAYDAAEPQLTAGKWTDGEQVRITIDSTLATDTWYHVIYEIRKAPEEDANNYYLLFQLNDENNDKIQSKFAGFNNLPAFADNPVRIGGANQARGGSSSINGQIDHYQSYNYATNMVTVDAAPSISSDALSNQPSGSENYTVEATITPGLGSSISTADLNYRIDGGEWTTVPMSSAEGSSNYSADIPSAPDYSIIDYYIETTNEGGFTSTFPTNAESGIYNSFAVEVEETEVLTLNFEGTGIPEDVSNYNSKVVAEGGDFSYADGADGNQAVVLDGEDDYLKVHNPVIAASEEFAVDFWFNANSFDQFWSFIMNQPSLCEGCWGENAFEVLYGAFDDSDWKITAGVWNNEEGSKRITLPHLLQTNTWYRVLLEVGVAPEDSSYNYTFGVELRDSNNETINSDMVTLNNSPMRSNLPMVIGKAGGVEGFPDYFDGKIDNVNIYNYAALGLVPTSSEANSDLEIPNAFELYQNYPNPFNPTTQIKYTVPSNSDVTIEVFNMLGQKVSTLVNEKRPAGTYTLQFDASNLSSGMYLYRMKTGSFTKVQKMILIK